jgi:cardiolipin synthase
MFPLSIDWPWPWLEALVLLAHIGLAGSVTVDALLKKSEVRTALGWIAAAWLSPIFGSLLYYLFGINRVTRRALKMRLRDRQAEPRHAQGLTDSDPNIALLCQVSGRVTGSPLTQGNGMTILRDGDQAYPAMLDAIRQAQHGIAIASYIFRDDTVGRGFTDALIAAHRRGVAVRVLLDGVGTGYFLSGILARLRAAGVPSARFLHTWLPWRMPFLNMRNHRKLLVADGRIGFVGGINIGIENSTILHRKRQVQDVHFRVEGPVVRELMDAFARDWTFATEEMLDQDHWWPVLEEKGAIFARGLRSGPDADIYKIEFILGAALTLAKKRVRIVTPYFLPEQRLQFAIAQAGLRGVKVEILLPQVSDQTIMDWAMRGHLRFFRHVRADFFLTPPPFDHSKLCTVDGEWTLIGSSNWDTRSFRLNFEFDLECTGREFTRQVDAIIDAKLAAARRITPEELSREPMWKRVRNAAARLLMPYL